MRQGRGQGLGGREVHCVRAFELSMGGVSKLGVGFTISGSSLHIDCSCSTLHKLELRDEPLRGPWRENGSIVANDLPPTSTRGTTTCARAPVSASHPTCAQAWRCTDWSMGWTRAVGMRLAEHESTGAPGSAAVHRSAARDNRGDRRGGPCPAEEPRDPIVAIQVSTGDFPPRELRSACSLVVCTGHGTADR